MRGDLSATNQTMRLKCITASVLIHAIILAAFLPKGQDDPQDTEVIEIVPMNESAMIFPKEETAKIPVKLRLLVPAAKPIELERPDTIAAPESAITKEEKAQTNPISSEVEIRNNPPKIHEPQKDYLSLSLTEGMAAAANEPPGDGVDIGIGTGAFAGSASGSRTIGESHAQRASGIRNGSTGEGIGDDSNIPRFGSPAGPRFLKRKMPQYPFAARKLKKEGKVVLAVTIDMNGCLRHVDVLEASDPLFVPPSIAALEKSSFLPAVRNGSPITVKAILPIRFALSD
jgi:TonB family protein